MPHELHDGIIAEHRTSSRALDSAVSMNIATGSPATDSVRRNPTELGKGNAELSQE
jgi:hypothetical protein